LADALTKGGPDAHVDVRVFGKPTTRPYRRMAVALARMVDGDSDQARALAVAAATAVRTVYD
jgi:phosphoribosylglycinamide formyltransferase 2